MNKGEKRRNRRKRKLRYDRVAIVAIIFILLIVFIVLFAKSCSDDTERESVQTNTTETDNIQASEEVNTEETPTESDNNIIVEDITEEPTENNSSDKDFVMESYDHDKVYEGDLVLVNADYEYKFIEGDTTLLTLFDNKNHNYNASDYAVTLDASVIQALNKMMTAFLEEENRENSNIWIIDGYRTYETQEKKYLNGESIFSAGHSDYHTGRTFDMSVIEDDDTRYAFSAEGQYEWFAENASRYGFIVRFPEDKKDITGENPRPRTYRYVGYPHALYMLENNLCFEEYIEELKSHNKDNPIIFNADGEEYKIYYVQAEEEGETEVLVPKNDFYTVSGNNVDGFIVTVEP